MRAAKRQGPASLSPDNHVHRYAPFALITEDKGTERLYALNDAAVRVGLRRGRALADARAICLGLMTRDADLSRDATALTMLAYWCQRYSPWVNVDGRDGLLLDISGCAHLFGGEEALCRDVQRRLGAQGIQARIGLADTPGAAWALARYGKYPVDIAPPDDAGERLKNLPVSALRLDDDVVILLFRFGLKTIGSLINIPRPALARRFSSRTVSESVLQRLDQALGRRHESVTPLQAPPEYRSRLDFAEPVSSREAIEHALDDLSHNLTGKLAEDYKGAGRFSLVAYRVGGDVSRVSIALANASRSSAHIKRLFAEKLDLMDPGFGIDTMMLEARMVEILSPDQHDLSAHQGEKKALAVLTDRFLNRFGARHILTLSSQASHIPEQAAGLAPFTRDDDDTGLQAGLQPRPLSLLVAPEPVTVMAEVPEGPPVRFSWRKKSYQVASALGPERISCPWWLDDDPAKARARTRDYYRVEDRAGHRFWLYREGLCRDGAGQHWYMHGMFI